VAITTGGAIAVTGASGSTGIAESTTSGTGMVIVNGPVTAMNGSGVSLASTTGNVTLENNNVITGAGTVADPVVRFVSTGGAVNGALQLNNNPDAIIRSNAGLDDDL